MNINKKLFLVLSVLSLSCLHSFSVSAFSVKIGSYDWYSAKIHSAIAS